MIGKKMRLDENTIDYIVYHNKEEIFINIVFDDIGVVQLTNVAIVKTEDKEDIRVGLKTIESQEYLGTLGLLMAVNNVNGYIIANLDSGFLENDVYELTKGVNSDIKLLRERSYKKVDSSRKGKKLKTLLDGIYKGRLDD